MVELIQELIIVIILNFITIASTGNATDFGDHLALLEDKEIVLVEIAQEEYILVDI